MDLSPILPGRLPGSLVTGRLTDQLQNAHRTLVQLQDQIATGQKFFIPSENPAAASRTINLQTLLERKTQMASNVAIDKSFLSASESALGSVTDALNRAKQLASAGIGNSSGPEEKAGMALEAQSLLRQVVNAGNTTFRGRYLFGGSQTARPPFTLLAENAVRYEGDGRSLESFADVGLLLGNNLDGHSALGALTPAVGSDVNPVLTLQTQVSDLVGGQGVTLGQIAVTLSNPAETKTVDLSGAKTIADVKALVENSFAANSVTVSINAAQNGLMIVPTAGTVAVANVTGDQTATDLGIVSAAAAAITGTDLNPRMSLTTTLASLNGGTGIGATAGNGLKITNGNTTQVVDISSAVTVEDLLNLLRQPGLSLSAEINPAGNGLAISSRLSGVSFSIGENNGTNATRLGIRTFTATTPLADLDFGQGVPVNDGLLFAITRRDGTVASVDLSGSVTVQDVLDKINAVSPGNLVASLNTVGNGISLTDNSGAGPLTVDASAIGEALGLVGSEPGNNNTVPLVGSDPNPLEVHGSLNVFLRLQRALETGDNKELTRINAMVDQELPRLNQTRGDLGGRLKMLDDIDNRLKDQQVQIKESISTDFDTDMTEVLTQLVNQQTNFQASLKAAAQTLQMSLLNYL